MKSEQIPVPMPPPPEPAKPKVSRSNVHVEVVDMIKSETESSTDITIDSEGNIIEESLTKSVMNILNSGHIERLSFQEDPRNKGSYQSLYHPKLRLLSDSVLKRISIQDDLVAAIVRARQNHLSSFGRPRPDRFSTGFILKPKTGLLDRLNEQEREAFSKQVEKAVQLLWTCGRTDGIEDDKKQSFSEWLSMCTRSAVVVGRVATEFVYRDEGGQKKFHYFRSVDAGTIYRAAVDSQTQTDTLRSRALHDLERLLGRDLRKEPKSETPMAWIQVIEGTPVQAFTAEELKVLNFYPVPDIEMDGYPVTPLDTVITAVTTHINITTHNRLYFQNGRASKGMIVINSDDIGPAQVKTMKQQMNASVNGVSNCIDGSSFILSQEAGGGSIADYVGDTKEKKLTIWTPTGWQSALAYKTGPKKLTETVFSNGVKLKVSPDHRIKTVDSEGRETWKRQSELVVGDFVLANSGEASTDNTPTFRGRPVVQVESINRTEDLTEMYDVSVMNKDHLCSGAACEHHSHAFFVNGIHCHNSWRLPVFTCGLDESISWQSMDAGGARDSEFTYLTDQNARVILSAFMMSPEELPGWSYLSRGTNSQSLAECVASDTKIGVRGLGQVSIGDFVGDKKEVRAQIWTGTNWAPGRAFRSGEKPLMSTEVACGLSIRTSPDHRFLVLNDSGETEWRHQSDLRIGDSVLVNKTEIPEDKALSFGVSVLNEEIAEVLGWALGDGTMFPPRNRVGGGLKLFYHHDKEQDVLDRHLDILNRWGLKARKSIIKLTPEQVEGKRVRGGFRSVSDTVTQVVVNNSAFYRWLAGLGFVKDGTTQKAIPDIAHSLSPEIRGAILRGLFSADGHVSENNAIVLTCQNDLIRDPARLLLLGLGIRTLSLKGLLRRSFGGVKTFSKKLSIKDRDVFWGKVGFVQDHKRDRQRDVGGWNIDKPPIGFVRRVLTPCVESDLFKTIKKSTRDSVLCAIRGVKRVTYKFIQRVLDLCGVNNPVLDSYRIEKVVKLEDLGQDVEMFDVEIFDDTHAFVANGFVTHNSSNEYRLEANRDLGIRPLLSSFEDFVNSEIMPVLDPDLAKKVDFRLVGLEAESAEKEAIRLQQDSFHMTFDDILSKVEKRPIGQTFAAQIPLNEVYKSYLDQYFTVGEILEHFCGRKDASKDPSLAYRRDPFFFQWVQLQQQNQMMQQQAQAQAQQGAAGGQPPQQQAQEDPQNPPEKTEKQKSDDVQDLSRSIDQAWELMSKSEANLSPEKKRLLAQHKKTVEFFLDGFAEDAREATSRIMADVKKIKKR